MTSHISSKLFFVPAKHLDPSAMAKRKGNDGEGSSSGATKRRRMESDSGSLDTPPDCMLDDDSHMGASNNFLTSVRGPFFPGDLLPMGFDGYFDFNKMFSPDESDSESSTCTEEGDLDGMDSDTSEEDMDIPISDDEDDNGIVMPAPAPAAGNGGHQADPQEPIPQGDTPWVFKYQLRERKNKINYVKDMCTKLESTTRVYADNYFNRRWKRVGLPLYSKPVVTVQTGYGK